MSKMKRLQRSEEDQSFNQQLVLWGETLAPHMCIVTTKQMKAMNADAIEYELNRALSDCAIELLDPCGQHLIVETSVFDDGSTYRHLVMLKMIGRDEPQIGFVDTTIDTPGHRAWQLAVGAST